MSISDSLCTIFSTSLNINPPDPKPEFSYYDIDNLTTEKIKRQGIGVFCKINETIFVITCFHIIGHNNLEINSYYHDFQIPLKIFNSFPELDIIILELKDGDHKKLIKYFITIENIIKLDSVPKDNISLFSQDIVSEKIIHKKENITNPISINNDFVVSTLIPKIPLIEYNSSIEVLSGSVLVSDNKILGIVSHYNFDECKLKLIPANLLFKIVSLSSIKIFVFSTSIVDFIDDDGNKAVGKLITDSYNIAYQVYDSRKLFSFRQNDVIYEINDNKLNLDGTIYDDSIGYDLPIDTYMMINTDPIKIKYYRKFFGKYVSESKELIGKSYDTIYQSNIFNTNKYLTFKGLIFTELFGELNSFDKYKDKISDKKVLVLIGSTEATLHTPMILDKIQNKKYNSLEDLKTHLMKIKNKTTFNFVTENNSKVSYVS